MKRLLAALAMVTAAAFATVPASAQGKIEVGQLTCSGKGGIGLIIVSKKSFDCVFKPVGNRPAQRYRGTVTNLGLDLGATGDTVLVWSVLASADQIRPGVLAGQYTGVGADASIAVGGGANVLVGGSKKQVSLQPLSAQAQKGLNIAAGVKGLTLRAN